MDPTHLFLTLGAAVGLLGTVGLLAAAAGTAVVDLLPDRPVGRSVRVASDLTAAAPPGAARAARATR